MTTRPEPFPPPLRIHRLVQRAEGPTFVAPDGSLRAPAAVLPPGAMMAAALHALVRRRDRWVAALVHDGHCVGAVELAEPEATPLPPLAALLAGQVSTAPVMQACYQGTRCLGWHGADTRDLRLDEAVQQALRSGRSTIASSIGHITLTRLRGGDDVVIARCEPYASAPVPPCALRLTPAQLETATLAADGLRAPEIAARLERSPETVRSHLRAIYRRLGIAHQAALAPWITPWRPWIRRPPTRRRAARRVARSVQPELGHQLVQARP